MKLRQHSRWFIYPTVALLAFGVLKWRRDGGFFNYLSVCRQCGAEQRSTDFLWLFPIHEVRPTRLSLFAAANHLYERHPHDWVFGVGTGEGVSLAVGEGREMLHVSRSAGFISFLAASQEYQGTRAAQHWLRGGLDPHTAAIARYALQLDTNLVHNAEDFGEWFTRVQTAWDLDEPVD